jgi:hypothetical protein
MIRTSKQGWIIAARRACEPALRFSGDRRLKQLFLFPPIMACYIDSHQQSPNRGARR